MSEAPKLFLKRTLLAFTSRFALRKPEDLLLTQRIYSLSGDETEEGHAVHVLPRPEDADLRRMNEMLGALEEGANYFDSRWDGVNFPVAEEEEGERVRPTGDGRPKKDD